MTPLTVALVGAGVIARTHVDIIAGHPQLRLVAVVDTDPRAGSALAARAAALGVAAPDVHLTLAAAQRVHAPDLVVITTPSATHADLAQEALAGGSHVMIEKPVDAALGRARDLLHTAARTPDRIVSVISQNRLSPAVVAVTDAVRVGRFGTITSAAATLSWWRSDDYYASAGWRGTWEGDGGGALMNQGVHVVDVLLSLLGTPDTVSAVARTVGHRDLDVEDVAGAVVTFTNGAVATLLATTAAFPENSTRLQVHGTAGSAFLQDWRLEYFHADDAHPEGEPRGWGRAGDQSPTIDLPGDAAITDLVATQGRQYDDLIRAIRSGEAPTTTLDAAVTALAVIVSVYVSNTLGRPVRVSDVLAGAYDDVDYTRLTPAGSRSPGRTFDPAERGRPQPARPRDAERRITDHRQTPEQAVHAS